MARFLVEVPHEANVMSCIHAVEVFLRSGSHFLTHADWGCKDGDHKCWIVLDVDSREDATAVVPPAFRAHAKIVQLNSFTLRDVEDVMRQHGA